MMKSRFSFSKELFGMAAIFTLAAFSLVQTHAAEGRAVRILFLGHESTHHNSDVLYPLLSKSFGRDAIYFDYVTDVAEALNPDTLNRYDGLLLYANHARITQEQLNTLISYVESGHGFIPLHSASACFGNSPEFIALVGASFQRHGTGEFQARIVEPGHPALEGFSEFTSWDESYVHSNHNEENRTVLMMRDDEPWTWVRTQGEGRVFYTASGHDQRTWNQPEFQQLVKSGILWAVGDEVRAEHDQFLATRTPLEYERRDNIPNYEKRPQPLPYQLPLSPEDSMDYTKVPAEFELKLFAAEPDIVNPIAMAWDERGRLWVAETVDYPNRLTDGPGNDRIKILEDTNYDGKADKITVFAEGFNIPTSIAFANGGVIVAHMPDFIFLKDTDGDDRADVREVFISGWGKRDTHAGPSNLHYGFDNWIYGNVGYSRFQGTVGGKDFDFGQGVYRIRPDGSEMEYMYQFNNNTWGLGFNEAGDVFASTANGNPSFYGGIPAALYPEGMGGMSAKMIADTLFISPITPNIRQVDVMGGYTAGAGSAFANSAGFPEKYRKDLAFINEPTGGVTGMFRMVNDGAGYKAINSFDFLASADEWFSPVSAEVGPDGALWIADWYSFIIQHNPTPTLSSAGYDAENGPGNAYINPNRDRQHGRIYRVVWNDAPASSLKSLANASGTGLVKALSDENQFWRLTAQRLLVEKNHTDVVPQLRETVRNGGVAAIHALWALSGLNVLDLETHQFALLSSDPALRRNAVKALRTDSESLQLFFDVAVLKDSDLHVRLAAFNQLSRFPTSDVIKQSITQLLRDEENRNEEWLFQSLLVAQRRHGVTAIVALSGNLLPNASFEEEENGLPAGWQLQTIEGELKTAIDTEVKYDGMKSFLFHSPDNKGAKSRLFTTVPVKPDTDYRLAGWVETGWVRGDEFTGVAFGIEGMSPQAGLTRVLQRSNEWQEIDLVFSSGNRSEIRVNAIYGTEGPVQGEAWIDNLSLTEVSTLSNEELRPGDPNLGKVIFDSHPIAACIRCHKIGGEGGEVGPVLDGIATRKPVDYIRQSLVDPNAALAEGFVGEMSPMPPMGVLLKNQELEDLIAYLTTLK